MSEITGTVRPAADVANLHRPRPLGARQAFDERLGAGVVVLTQMNDLGLAESLLQPLADALLLLLILVNQDTHGEAVAAGEKPFDRPNRLASSR